LQPGEVERKPKEAFEYINRRLKWPFKTDELTKEQVQIQKAYYYSTCTLVDDWVGRIVEVLRELGLYDNTILIFSSDHGDLLGDHGLVYKQCFYEQSVKAPLIVHNPKRFVPRRVSDMVEALDLFTTFCDLAGTRPGEGNQGKSLLPILENLKGYTHREAAFSENYFGRMVRYDQYKMIYYPGKPYGELYDLEEDPDEQRNLWDELEGSPIKRQLKDLLLDWAFVSEDPLPLPVRPDHQDMSPRVYELDRGGTRECETQPWYLQDLLPLYQDWDFHESGVLR
jgi:arylsulfatase A-like enzyme